MSILKAWLFREWKSLRRVSKRNLQVFRSQPWNELSGAFGDIGTFIPIFVVLSQPSFRPQRSNNHAAFSIEFASFSDSQLEPAISPASTLAFSGLANILTGIYFGLPLPVQPMKAIAAVAIADPGSYNAANLASAGLFVGGAIGVLSVTGAVKWFAGFVPLPIVRGIQVGAGLSLAVQGFLQLLGLQNEIRQPHTIDNIVNIAGTVLALLLLGICTLRPRLPYALVIVLASLVVGLVWLLFNEPTHGVPTELEPGLVLWRPSIWIPKWPTFVQGAISLGIGQIPLTALNSIVAVVSLAESLFPSAAEDLDLSSSRSNTPSVTAVGISVALMNLISCWFHSMPVCHGSGGLAAQYAFGARSGMSVIILGLLKVVLGLFFSGFVYRWSTAFPSPVLGILLVLAGLELVKTGESVNTPASMDLWTEVEVDRAEVSNDEAAMLGITRRRRFIEPSKNMCVRRYIIMMATAAASLGLHNAGLGFVVGLMSHWMYQLRDWEVRRLEARESLIRLYDGARESSRIRDDT